MKTQPNERHLLLLSKQTLKVSYFYRIEPNNALIKHRIYINCITSQPK